eukprot:Amastigsp_a351357_5.p3 type:complete len:115 gc:universal Amastigsp_a351357_5:435-91(-)
MMRVFGLRRKGAMEALRLGRMARQRASRASLDSTLCAILVSLKRAAPGLPCERSISSHENGCAESHISWSGRGCRAVASMSRVVAELMVGNETSVRKTKSDMATIAQVIIATRR